jgi:hypothetical protein
LAIASLVCACCGIIPFLGFIGAVLGIVFGTIARSQIARSRGNEGGSGLALAGILVGGFFLLVAVVVIALVASHGHLHHRHHFFFLNVL